MNKNIPAAEVTPEMIEQWKKEHGAVYKISVEDKAVYLRSPTRRDLSYASTVKDPIKYNETILKACWLAGDEEVKKEERLFLGIAGKLDGIMEVAQADLEKL